ncbi:hypothetical protein ALNOE001_18900 [Candidatus Methanobinarius endosymbioticus]|uniref:Uncharacterized protein n=1 Tax=Candidatus Methanobinarius endosymbioticus TaxID=2006182 RepID=A0A366M8I9_9EURY|nr:hypothetical protein ALNOE001_18900 [Candidatus Methanobinarius endosymbioticus]
MCEKEKPHIKTELLKKINSILDKNKVEKIDTLTIINSAKTSSYLGNIKVFDENIIHNLESQINELFEQYGKFSIRTEEVTSCCKPPCKNISFKVDID